MGKTDEGRKINENVCYLDLVDGYMNIYTHQNSSNCTLRLHFTVGTLNEKYVKITRLLKILQKTEQGTLHNLFSNDSLIQLPNFDTYFKGKLETNAYKQNIIRPNPAIYKYDIISNWHLSKECMVNLTFKN